jgi:SAM-dependent methyltransferase
MALSKFFKEQIKKPLNRQFHRGNKHHCPICGYKARDWKAIGRDNDIMREYEIIGGGRRRGGCYGCGSNERERQIYLYLKAEQLKNPEKLTVLHIAPEDALSKKLLEAGFKEYVCGDLFNEGYSYPSHVRNMDILEIPFPDATFDLIICNHVLEHIQDDRRAMSELYRVLKPTGKALVQVPFSRKLEQSMEDPSIREAHEREAAFGQFDHVRIYGLDYFSRLREAGFLIEEINLSDSFPKAGINPEENLIIGSK